MQCSNCGKVIPFYGKVCPHCLRDKSKDQSYNVLALALGIGIGFLGALFFGFWGAVIGFFGGCLIAASVTGVFEERAPPEVMIETGGADTSIDTSISARLETLEALRREGAVTEGEYVDRRESILSEI